MNDSKGAINELEPEEVVNAYSGLIVKIASQYQFAINNNGAVGFDDLIQEGRIAVLSAMKTFDPEKGLPFSSWVALHIKKRIRNTVGFRSDGSFKEDPALYLDAPPPGDDSGEVRLIDTLPDDTLPGADEIIIRNETAEEVREAVSRIRNESQRSVIEKIYFEGKSYAAVAKEMQITTSALIYRRKNALKKLRRDWKLKECLFPDYRESSLSRFRHSGVSIVEKAILRLESEFNKQFGENAFAESIMKNHYLSKRKDY